MIDTPIFSHECNFLSAVLQNSEEPELEEALSLLTYANFADDRTRKVYAAIQDIWSRGKTPDPANVYLFLVEKRLDGLLKDFLMELTAHFIAAGSLQLIGYARKVREASDLRQTQKFLEDALDKACSGTFERDDIVEDLQTKLDSLNVGSGKVELYGPGQISARRIEGLTRRAKYSEISTGWKELDVHLVAPFSPGDIVIVKGARKLGKSTAKTNLAINMADAGKVILFVSPEQLFDGEADRLDACKSGIPLSALKNWANWPKDDPRRKELQEVNLYWDEWCKFYHLDSRATSLSIIRWALRRVKAESGKVDVVFIDLFDRVADLQVSNNKTAVIEMKLLEITKIAEEFECALVLLVQENDEGKTKWAGAYEEYASLILEVQRPKMEDPSYHTDELILSVYLQRNGPSGGQAKFVVDSSTLKLIPQEQFYETAEAIDGPVRGSGAPSSPAS